MILYFGALIVKAKRNLRTKLSCISLPYRNSVEKFNISLTGFNHPQKLYFIPSKTQSFFDSHIKSQKILSNKIVS